MHVQTIPEKSRETIVAYVEPALAERLRKHAKEQERSISGEIRLALRRHLEHVSAAGAATRMSVRAN
jgi:hypothetical protein